MVGFWVSTCFGCYVVVGFILDLAGFVDLDQGLLWLPILIKNRKKSHEPSYIALDGWYGEKTINVTSVNTDNKDLSIAAKPFVCPCCGGNSYTNKHSGIYCDFCGTKYIGEL